MDYQWDKNKEQSNRHKHGIAFADATAVFSDDNAFIIEDDYPDEERFAAIGADAFGSILVVVSVDENFGNEAAFESAG